MALVLFPIQQLTKSYNLNVNMSYLAGSLGIKDTLPAYLDPNLRDQDLSTGVSFASAGTGNDDLTAQIQVIYILVHYFMYKLLITNIESYAKLQLSGLYFNSMIFYIYVLINYERYPIDHF